MAEQTIPRDLQLGYILFSWLSLAIVSFQRFKLCFRNFHKLREKWYWLVIRVSNVFGKWEANMCTWSNLSTEKHAFIAFKSHGLSTLITKCYFLTVKTSDTLLNVFLAIAVDNLAYAHVLTEDEKNERLAREAKNKPSEESVRSQTQSSDIGHLTKTVALVKSRPTPDQTTEESNCDATGAEGCDELNYLEEWFQCRHVLIYN